MVEIRKTCSYFSERKTVNLIPYNIALYCWGVESNRIFKVDAKFLRVGRRKNTAKYTNVFEKKEGLPLAILTMISLNIHKITNFKSKFIDIYLI